MHAIIIDAIENNREPDYKFSRREFVIDTCGAKYIKVFSEKDFITSSIDKECVFDLQNDISVSSTINLSLNKTCYIKGNGFSISEKGYKSKTFSAPVKALRWTVDTINSTATFYVPRATAITNAKDLQNMYVNYEVWFLRFRGQMISVTDSTIICRCNENRLKDKRYLKYTPQPYVFLEVAPSEHKSSTLMKVNMNSRVLIENTTFRNVSSLCVKNEGVLKIRNCNIQNIDNGCVSSSGNLYIDSCRFTNITSTPINASRRSYLEVVNSTFSEIGLRGSNTACIKSHGDSYIADNTFKDFNYSAISVGQVDCKQESDLPSSWIEHNILYWTNEWNEKIVQYGLRDGGAIQVATNNKQCVVKNNTILNIGGHGSNRAIFCDDGAYNITIIGNVISGTQNSYDIDSRDCSKRMVRTVPESCHPNTNNFICNNVCSGYIRFEGNPIEKSNRCICEDNIIVGKDFRHENVISHINQNAPILNDQEGSIDCYGVVHLKLLKDTIDITAPNLKLILENDY